jgi:hypothetical protein
MDRHPGFAIRACLLGLLLAVGPPALPAAEESAGPPTEADRRDMQQLLQQPAMAAALKRISALTSYCHRLRNEQSGRISLQALRRTQPRLLTLAQGFLADTVACRKATAATAGGRELKQRLLRVLDGYARALPRLLEATNTGDPAVFKEGGGELAAANRSFTEVGAFVAAALKAPAAPPSPPTTEETPAGTGSGTGTTDSPLAPPTAATDTGGETGKPAGSTPPETTDAPAALAAAEEAAGLPPVPAFPLELPEEDFDLEF